MFQLVSGSSWDSPGTANRGINWGVQQGRQGSQQVYQIANIIWDIICNFQVFCCKDLFSANSKGYLDEKNLGIRSSPSLRDNCPSGKIVFVVFLVVLYWSFYSCRSLGAQTSDQESQQRKTMIVMRWRRVIKKTMSFRLSMMNMQ